MKVNSKKSRLFCLRLLCALLSTWTGVSLADAIMVNRSVTSSSIAQYYIEDEGVRVELEIGLDSLEFFANLMPDGLYEKLRDDGKPREERLQEFFNQDLALLVNAEPLPGYVRELGPGKRVLRDPISGEVLPVQLAAPDIIRGELFYPFSEGAPPEQLLFTSPARAQIGFVVYHGGVAVNDYRYLGNGYHLDLDWEDPWYSSFGVSQLKRQYREPMSGFLYVENFEVRKEIIVRPKDLQRWVDLGLEGRSDIPPEVQPEMRRRVGEFLSSRHPVTIDGESVEGALESVNFLARTLNSSRVIDPPELLELDSAIIGAIFVYPRKALPQKVSMEWDLWDERVKRIPVSAVDEAGPLPSYLDPEWPVLEWINHLTNPTVPTLRVIEKPAAAWRAWLQTATPALVALAMFSVLVLWRNRSKGGSIATPSVLTFVFLVLAIGAARYGADNEPNQARAEVIVADLLHNVYRAFDYREEGDIYDVLDRSVSGELLTDIFLETKRSLVLANQGGAEAKVQDIALTSVEVLPGSRGAPFKVKADWTVNGSVGHWGHVHQRSNRYLAELTLIIDEANWKLGKMNVLQEERL